MKAIRPGARPAIRIAGLHPSPISLSSFYLPKGQKEKVVFKLGRDQHHSQLAFTGEFEFGDERYVELKGLSGTHRVFLVGWCVPA